MLMGQFTNNFLTLSTKRESCDLANDLTDFLARSDHYRYVRSSFCPYVRMSVVYMFGMYSIGCDSQLAPRSTSLLSLQKKHVIRGAIGAQQMIDCLFSSNLTMYM